MRPIDADALENEVHTFCREFIGSCRDFRTKCALYDAMKGVLVRIYDAPTLSPDEVRGVGKWEQKEIFGVEETTIEQMQSACCSVCGKYHTTPYSYYFSKYNYCPNCGARMKGLSEDA